MWCWLLYGPLCGLDESVMGTCCLEVVRGATTAWGAARQAPLGGWLDCGWESEWRLMILKCAPELRFPLAVGGWRSLHTALTALPFHPHITEPAGLPTQATSTGVKVQHTLHTDWREKLQWETLSRHVHSHELELDWKCWSVGFSTAQVLSLLYMYIHFWCFPTAKNQMISSWLRVTSLYCYLYSLSNAFPPPNYLEVELNLTYVYSI